MVFMLPMEFLAPFIDDEEIDFPDQIAQLALDPMTAIFEKPADDERQHLRALFIKGRVDGQPMTKILVDGGAAFNIMPYAVYRKLGKGDQDLTKTDMMLKDFEGNVSPVKGAICNTPSVSLHVNHEHCTNISIIMLIHKHPSRSHVILCVPCVMKLFV